MISDHIYFHECNYRENKLNSQRRFPHIYGLGLLLILCYYPISLIGKLVAISSLQTQTSCKQDVQFSEKCLGEICLRVCHNQVTAGT